MALVSMATNDGAPDMPAASQYGYGLCINLNDDQCEALGIKSPLKAGTVVRLTALAFVKSTTESVEDDGDDAGTDVSMALQITDLELSGKGSSSMGDLASKMYK